MLNFFSVLGLSSNYCRNIVPLIRRSAELQSSTNIRIIKQHATNALRVLTVVQDIAAHQTYQSLSKDSTFKLQQDKKNRSITHLRHKNGVLVFSVKSNSLENHFAALKERIIKLNEELGKAIINTEGMDNLFQLHIAIIRRIPFAKSGRGISLSERISSIIDCLHKRDQSIDDLIFEYLGALQSREIDILSFIQALKPAIGTELLSNGISVTVNWKILHYHLQKIYPPATEFNDSCIPCAESTSMPPTSAKRKYVYLYYPDQYHCQIAWDLINFHFYDTQPNVKRIPIKRSQDGKFYLQLTQKQYEHYTSKCADRFIAERSSSYFSYVSSIIEAIWPSRPHLLHDRHLFKVIQRHNWSDFIDSLIHGVRKPLRSMEPRLKYTARLNPSSARYEVVLTDKNERDSLYGSEKQGYTKHQSTTLYDGKRGCTPPVFGHLKNRANLLSGIRFAIDQVLVQRIFTSDKGSYNRFYDFPSEDRALETIKRALEQEHWHSTLESLADFSHSEKNIRYNEVMARLKVAYDSRVMLSVYSNTMEARLLTQLRAVDFNLHMQYRAKKAGKMDLANYRVLITKYYAGESKDGVIETNFYTEREQQKDRVDALDSTNDVVKKLGSCLSIFYGNKLPMLDIQPLLTTLDEFGLTKKLKDELKRIHEIKHKQKLSYQQKVFSYSEFFEAFCKQPNDEVMISKIKGFFSHRNHHKACLQQLLPLIESESRGYIREKLIVEFLSVAIKEDSATVTSVFNQVVNCPIAIILGVDPCVDKYIYTTVFYNNHSILFRAIEYWDYKNENQQGLIDTLSKYPRTTQQEAIPYVMPYIQWLLPWTVCRKSLLNAFLTYIESNDITLEVSIVRQMIEAAIVRKSKTLPELLELYSKTCLKHQSEAKLGLELIGSIVHAIGARIGSGSLSLLMDSMKDELDARVALLRPYMPMIGDNLPRDLYQLIYQLQEEISMKREFEQADVLKVLSNFSKIKMQSLVSIIARAISTFTTINDNLCLKTYHNFRGFDTLSPLTRNPFTKSSVIQILEERALDNPYGASAMTLCYLCATYAGAEYKSQCHKWRSLPDSIPKHKGNVRVRFG